MNTFTLDELAKAIDAHVVGDGNCKISQVASIVHAKAGDISLLADLKYKKYLAETKASAVLLNPKFAKDCPVNALVMKNPKAGFVKLIQLFCPKTSLPQGRHPSVILGQDCDIHPTATIGAQVVIGDRVKIGAHVSVGPGCVIGNDTVIGEESCLYSRVSIYHGVTIGKRTICHSGAVIGADGFGFAEHEGQWLKIPQVGGVVIGDDVEIGANTTIDRGALDDTIIGNGVKIDNLVMIGHNVRIGDYTIIAGCAGIAGSTEIGKYCMIGASAGINGHIRICDKVIITGMAMIQKSITVPGAYSSGTGMQTNREWHKSVIRFWQLDDLVKRIRQLERVCDEQNGK